MVDFLGVDILIILSYVPAVFALLLSVFNWYQMNKPANIHTGELVNYGFISSSYENCMLFCLPLVFENEGAKKGAITEIKLGFQTNGQIKYIDVDLKVRLNEFTGAMIPSMNFEKFTEEGYAILLPTYPIIIDAGESISTTIVTTVGIEEGIVPIGIETEFIIEVYFGKNKSNRKSIPFYLSQKNAESDNVLLWLKPVDKDN